MKHNYDLFSLITKLLKTEKTYYRKFAVRHFDKDNSLLKLYSLIERQAGSGSYDENTIKAKLNSGKMQRNFPVNKIYLYNNILKSLNLYYAEENIDLKLSMLINNSILLYNKGLFTQSLKFANKAKTLAENNNRFVKQLEAIQCERMSLRINTSLNEVSEELMNNYTEEQAVLDKLNNISEYRRLYDTMVIAATHEGFRHGKRGRNKFDLILANRLLTESSNAKYFQSRILYYLMHCFLNNLKGNYSVAVQFGKECLELIGDSQTNRTAAVYEYILIIQELMLGEFSIGNITEADNYYRRLINEQDDLLKTSQERIRTFLITRTLTIKLNLNFETGNFYDSIEIINMLTAVTEKIAGTAYRDEVIVTDFMAAAVFFAVSDFDKSLYHLNRIFNSKLFALREDIQVSCRLLSLLVHYEIGNLSSLEYFTRSTYRYLVKLEKLNRFEKLLIEFLRRIYKTNGNNEITDLFKETRKKLNIALKEEPGILQFINLDAWLRSKIENRSYFEILQEKSYK